MAVKSNKVEAKMVNIKSFFKRLVLSLLPERMLQIIKKVYYARILKSFSENNEVDLKVVRYLVNPGDYTVDVGANIGVYTKHLSEYVGIHGHVYSIEPFPLTFEILCSNVKKLGLKSVVLVNCAISDNNGSVTMEVPLYESGVENFYQARIMHENTDNSLRRFGVESKTIDSLFSKLGHDISFIKCDVEGHELRCIKGAINIIKNSRPAWLIEMWGNPDELTSTAHEVFKLLDQEGYQAFWFDGINLKRRRSGDKNLNYFFLATKHLQGLREKGFLTLVLN